MPCLINIKFLFINIGIVVSCFCLSGAASTRKNACSRNAILVEKLTARISNKYEQPLVLHTFREHAFFRVDAAPDKQKHETTMPMLMNKNLMLIKQGMHKSSKTRCQTTHKQIIENGAKSHQTRKEN
jgi:hypothetical protein